MEHFHRRFYHTLFHLLHTRPRAQQPFPFPSRISYSQDLDFLHLWITEHYNGKQWKTAERLWKWDPQQTLPLTNFPNPKSVNNQNDDESKDHRAPKDESVIKHKPWIRRCRWLKLLWPREGSKEGWQPEIATSTNWSWSREEWSPVRLRWHTWCSTGEKYNCIGRD